MAERYRALERMCRQQAALSSHVEVKRELNEMAGEYRAMAEWLERQWPEENNRSALPRNIGEF